MNQTLQPAFRALADPTRRDILAILLNGEATVGQVADHFDMTRPAVAKHLRVLEDGDLIEVVARGRERVNRIKPDGLRGVVDWLARLDKAWDDRLSALKFAIESNTSPEKDTS